MKYLVKYLDSKEGTRVMTIEVEAEDSAEALEKAYDDDYYFGELISVEEIE